MEVPNSCDQSYSDAIPAITGNMLSDTIPLVTMLAFAVGGQGAA